MNQILFTYFYVNASKHRMLVHFVYMILLLFTMYIMLFST